MLTLALLAGALAVPPCSRAEGEQSPAQASAATAGRRNAAPSNPLAVEVPCNPTGYPQLFVKVLGAVGADFEIAYTNRYDGRIESAPLVSTEQQHPGVRRRAVVVISPADQEGVFFVDVKVFKEREEELPALKSGEAGHGPMPAPDTQWVPAGRDRRLESVILRRLAK
jgi:hypothetical protein